MRPDLNPNDTTKWESVMTWYAQQVFAQPRDDVIASIRDIPQLANAMYHIPHLHGMETEHRVLDGVLIQEDGPVDLYRPVRRGPKLPTDGLLVVRELCGSDDDHCASWFEEDAVCWGGIGHDLPLSDDPLLQYDTLFAKSADGWLDVAPPIEMLQQLQTIAATTKSVVAYYACHMWGGDVTCVLGWVWDGTRESSCFYRGIAVEDAEGKETVGFYTDLTGAYAIDRYGRKEIVDGDVLTLLLLHFGILLRDGYFELHTRSFPWYDYRLKN